MQIAKVSLDVDETVLIRPLEAIKSCMVLILESSRHRIETGSGLCRSFTGPKPRICNHKGRVVASVVLSAPERVHRFIFCLVSGSKAAGFRRRYRSLLWRLQDGVYDAYNSSRTTC